MKNLFGEEIHDRAFAEEHTPRTRAGRKIYDRPRGHAAPPGSGPAGETCGSCENCYCTVSNARRKFYKCALVKRTKGAATDIRKKHAACSRWEKLKPEERDDAKS